MKKRGHSPYDLSSHKGLVGLIRKGAIFYKQLPGMNPYTGKRVIKNKLKKGNKD
ncbi:MAG TPA: hypothetical protein PK367_01055 [Candidatus Paceibacterota bacterium]|nr:hypothetical protein [Candidatus Paceibacterota bacterium]